MENDDENGQQQYINLVINVDDSNKYKINVQEPFTIISYEEDEQVEYVEELETTEHYSIDAAEAYAEREKADDQEYDDLIEFEIEGDGEIKDYESFEETEKSNALIQERTTVEKRKYDALEDLEARLVGHEETVECYVCDFVGTTYRELKNHYRSHRELVCKVCSKTFDKQRYMMNFTRHYRYIHLPKEKRLRIRNNLVKTDQPKSMKDYAPLECFSCDHVASTTKERVEHSRIHRGNHSCKFCEYNSKHSWTNLKRHMVTIHAKRINTRNKNDPEWIYVSYLANQDGDEKFEDEQIYKKDEDLSDLSDTESTSNSEKEESSFPKICLCCEYIINSKNEKLEHYNEHEEFICKMCGYNANRLYEALKDHVIKEHQATDEIKCEVDYDDYIEEDKDEDNIIDNVEDDEIIVKEEY